MLCLPQTAGYAILALSCLEEAGGSLMSAKEIAEKTSIPRPYLSKILHALRQAGLVVSKRGYRGGVALGRPASEITLLEITEAAIGHPWSSRCLLGMAQCGPERCCPVHEFWEAQQQQLEHHLREVTLAEVARFEADRVQQGQVGHDVPARVAAFGASPE